MQDKNGLKLNSDNTVIFNLDNAKQMEQVLNQKGQGFCLAKWSQVTIHLANGLTHSCHHVKAHPIPLDELETNPSALHNTQYKKNMRKMMLNNDRPPECSYCWRIEDNKNISDRTYKSMAEWSYPHLEKIKNSTGDEDFYPSYVEVSFNNTCNFKCAYCSPKFSSKWKEEINQHGGIELLKGTNYHYTFNGDEDHKILNKDQNPYVEAWWKWFPDALPHMHTLRITGGEPLLIKDTYKVIDWLIAHPQPNLEFAINTNLCPPEKLWIEFLEKIKILLENKCVKDFSLFTSIEAEGAQAEYIRTGLDVKLFKSRTEEYLSTVPGQLIFMSAFNILSVPSFQKFLEWVLYLKRKYNYNSKKQKIEKLGYNFENSFINRINLENQPNRVSVSIPYVKNPGFLDARIVSSELIEKYLIPTVDFMITHYIDNSNNWNKNLGFRSFEVDHFIRIVDDLIKVAAPIESTTHPFATDQKIKVDRARFYEYVSEHDKRRNTKFLEVFPELEEFYNLCKEEGKRL
jgi:hypothetical protein